MTKLNLIFSTYLRASLVKDYFNVENLTKRLQCKIKTVIDQ